MHLGAIIVRDYSVKVSNYRSIKELDQYLKEQNVMGLSDVDTRAITRRLRDTGCLVAAITTDASISDEDLLAMTKNWTIVGKDLIKEVTCSAPYEWKDPTDGEWEFSSAAKEGARATPYKVRSRGDTEGGRRWESFVGCVEHDAGYT